MSSVVKPATIGVMNGRNAAPKKLRQTPIIGEPQQPTRKHPVVAHTGERQPTEREPAGTARASLPVAPQRHRAERQWQRIAVSRRKRIS